MATLEGRLQRLESALLPGARRPAQRSHFRAAQHAILDVLEAHYPRTQEDRLGSRIVEVDGQKHEVGTWIALDAASSRLQAAQPSEVDRATIAALAALTGEARHMLYQELGGPHGFILDWATIDEAGPCQDRPAAAAGVPA